MQIKIVSTEASRIRANQSGDWWILPGAKAPGFYYDENTPPDDFAIVVHVDKGLPSASQLAVAIHELVEAFRCKEDKVSEKDVCDFDERYEGERKDGYHKENHEPGDDPHAPYREQHMAATHVERAVCHALGLTWKEHEQSVMNLEGNHH